MTKKKILLILILLLILIILIAILKNKINKNPYNEFEIQIDLFEGYYNKADMLLADMTIEKKAR